ncbi:MAG: tetratricopeptide (TPR) repeat protein [Cognaticolwellia sp.]|jgi:tetratricopeptide (TPR) repeat protein
MLLLASLSWAQSVATGGLALQAGPVARVQTLPQVNPLRQQWVIHASDAPLSDQVPRNLFVPGLRSVDIYGVGGGSWMVGVELEEAGLVGAWRSGSDGELVLEFRVGNPVLVAVPSALSLEELLASPPKRVTQAVSSSSLQPLSGLASTLALQGGEIDPAFPVWTPNLPAEVRDVLRLEPAPTAETLDRYREALHHTDPYIRAVSAYRLAQAHEAMGMHREAAHYYRRVMESDGAWPRNILPLALARAELATERVDAAREACLSAWGVSRSRDEQVAVCLGLVSLQSADPAPAPLGRVLASVSGHPLHLLLAAQLLQADGYHREATPLLETALGALGAEDEHLERRIRASLGDAYLHQGRLDEARDQWRDVGHKGPLGEVIWLRQRTLVMVQSGPGEWAKHLPDLDAFVFRGGEGAAEALFLQAQVAITLGDDEAAADALVQILDHHRRVANANAIPLLLWEVLVRRLNSLERQDRKLDIIGLHRRYWRGGLEEVVQDTAPLELVVDAYTQTGLADQAMRIQRQIFAIQTRLGSSSPRDLLRLAELYQAAGRHDDALRTLDFLAGQGVPKGLLGRRQMALGEVLLSLDQEPEAREAWTRAEKLPGSQVKARLALAMLDARLGDCSAALPRLQALDRLEPEPDQARIRSGEMHLVMARCLLQGGDPSGAADAATEAAGRSPDEHTQRYATFLAAEAMRGAGQDPGMLQEALESGDDLWSDVAQGLSRDDAFRADLQRRRKGPID